MYVTRRDLLTRVVDAKEITCENELLTTGDVMATNLEVGTVTADTITADNYVGVTGTVVATDDVSGYTVGEETYLYVSASHTAVGAEMYLVDATKVQSDALWIISESSEDFDVKEDSESAAITTVGAGTVVLILNDSGTYRAFAFA